MRVYPLFGTIRIFTLISILAGCSGFERSEREKIRRKNCKGEYVYRAQEDVFFPIGIPEHTPRAPYPWENEAHLPRITKEFFRCKGTPLNPSYADPANPLTQVFDCEGLARHGLPIFAGKENVYPILIELLNFVQKKTGHRVIITCGHRCPAHNLYADPSKENRVSKHQIGAEVDFYVQGMEEEPLEVVGLLMQYYQAHSGKEWSNFLRYDKPDRNVVTPPWFNKEIFIKLYQKDEGRDADNRHPYPYVGIQVKYDREKKERVLYDWERASRGFPRS